jgi:hypothetical protein
LAETLETIQVAVVSSRQDSFANAVRGHLSAVPGVDLVDPATAQVVLLLDEPGGPPQWNPSLGVWFFRYDGLSECDRTDAITSGTLEQYTPRPGKRTVLEERHLKTDICSPWANRKNIRFGLTDAPARACRAILEGRFSPRECPALPVPPRPSALMPLKILLRELRRQFDSILFSEMWWVGLVEAPISRFLDPAFRPRVQWFPHNSPGRFLADPFAIEEDGKLRLLMEEFLYSENRGRIVEAEWANGVFSSDVWPAIDQPYHMSYPYPLMVDGMLHCVPESGAAGDVSAYRWTGEQWSAGRQILENFPATDPTIFPHGGHWWLLCTNRAGEVDAALYVWRSDHPLGPWEPHPANPVKVDVRSSRPGGTPFYSGGQLYRPAQDCSRTYGWRVTLNRITKLTPTEFEEQVVTVVEPPPGPYREGIHTLSGAGNFTVLDAKSFILDPPMIPKRLAHKLARIWETISK